MISPWINPGKIRYKFGQAGADGVVLVGSGQIGFWGKMEERDALALDRIEQSFFSDRDIILTEGFKKGDKPKIAVLTKGQEEKLLKEIEGSIVATVGESPRPTGLASFQAGRFRGTRSIGGRPVFEKSEQALYQGHPGWEKYPLE